MVEKKSSNTMLLLDIIKKLNSYDDSLVDACLRGFKGQLNYEELGFDFVTNLTYLLTEIKNASTRALLIETIVESSYYESDGELLDEYIFLLSQGVTTLDDASRCLEAFIVSGISGSEVLTKLSRSLTKEKAITILAHMSISKFDVIPSGLEQFVLELEKTRKIRYRLGVISAFLLVVHPLCSEYADISIPTFGYSSGHSAAFDWAWRTPNSTRSIVSRKIITEREARILERVGNLLNIDGEGYNNPLLDREEANNLLKEFFRGEDPFDVMYRLPD